MGIDMKALQRANRLLHTGAGALSEVSQNGVRLDLDWLRQAQVILEKRATRIEQKIEKRAFGKRWRKIHGHSMNLGSDDQLADVLFKHKRGFKLEPKAFTSKGAASVDQAALKGLSEDVPGLSLLLDLRSTIKANSTYIKGIGQQATNGILHPHFALHFVDTYRSSSRSPNFQNVPVRDPYYGRLIRKAFVAREGRQLIEIDFGSMEVRIAACYHHDPTMRAYLEDETTDMHRDVARDCFKIPTRLPVHNKTTRAHVKGAFVFAEFYGDYYENVATNLWGLAESGTLLDHKERPLMQHMKKKGIGTRAAFTQHIKNVEQDFWGERFPVYDAWRKSWYTTYQKRGWLQMKTGFVCRGFVSRNQCINYPVQGAAFHCLLWSLIELLKYMRKKKMRSQIVGQIHDSMVFDAFPEEVAELIAAARKIMTKKLPAAWDWVVIPLQADAEVSPVGGSWYDKEDYK